MTISADEAARLFELQDREGIFEFLIENCYSSILKPTDAAVDGGAHVGMHTLPMARLVGTSGRVFAFEPIHPLAETIRNQARILPQIRVVEAALSDEEGVTCFRYFIDEPWYSSIAERSLGDHKKVELISVPRFVLDSLAEEPIKFIKLDLESGEFHALRGACELLRRQKPILAIECGRADSANSAGYTQAEYFALFSSVGYFLLDLFGRPFTQADFGRPHYDRLVPHYIVGVPGNLESWSVKLKLNALRALAERG